MGIKTKYTTAMVLILGVSLFLTAVTSCNSTTGESSASSTLGTDLVIPHTAGFKNSTVHGPAYQKDPALCQSCHGTDLNGGTSQVSCISCHSTHASAPTSCASCHSTDKPSASHALTTADCSTCHTYTTGSFSMLKSHTTKFSQSGHASSTGAFSGHASQSCGRCHNATAAKDYMGVDGSAEFIVNATSFTAPGPLDCATCHNDKTTAYNSSGVTVYSGSGKAITVGREAFCVTCHFGRAGEGRLKIDAAIFGQAINTKMTGTYTFAQWPGNAVAGGTISAAVNRAAAIAPHYFPASMTFYGHDAESGYENSANSYATTNLHVDGYDTCMDCHDPHTTEVKITSCKTCHTNVNAVSDLANIRLHSTPDYDGDGNVTEGVAAEVEGVKAKLLQAIQNYAAGTYVGVPIYFNSALGQQKFVTTNGGTTSYSGANYTPLLLKATYNYVLADHDSGAYAHNSRYIIQLMYDSIKDLNDNGLDNGAHGNKVDMTGMYRPNP